MSNNGAATEMGRNSYIGRFNYSYKNKYLLQAIMRADASAKFSSDKDGDISQVFQRRGGLRKKNFFTI